MPFLQMPIFIAMFNVVRRITLEGGMYTNQVSNTYLFGIDLAANNDWYIAGALSALVGVTMFVLQSLAQKKPSYAKKTGTQKLFGMTYNRCEKIKKEHWKFTNNKEAQESGLVTVGEVAPMLTEPYYIGGYYFGASALS